MEYIYSNAYGEKMDLRIFESKSNDTDKYVVFTCAKDEDRYIREFVEHYLGLGFDKVVIADNNDIPGKLTMLDDFVNDNRVEILDFSGLKHIQLNSYEMFANAGNFKWCAFFDVDEFLEINPIYDSVGDFLDTIKEDCLMVHWLLYGSDGKFFYEEGRVQDRFKKPLFPMCYVRNNFFLKTILRRTDKKVIFPDSSHYCHFDGIRYNLDGEYVLDAIGQIAGPISYKNCYLKHYVCKSKEEFLLKQRRGWPDTNDISLLRQTEKIVELYDTGKEFDIVKLANYNIFWPYETSEEEEWLNYDVVVFRRKDGGNFDVISSWLIKSMFNVSGYTFLVPDTMTSEMFNRLLEVALHTGNTVIPCKENATEWWRMYLKMTRGKGETYYILTCE